MKNKLNHKTAGFVLSYVSIFVTSLVGVFFTPYMILSLGQDEYGLYQLLYATIGYVALLDFGLGSTLTRFILRYEADNDKEKIASVISISVRIYCFISCLVMAIVTVVSFKLDDFFVGTINSVNLRYSQKLFLIMGLTSALSLISHALNGIQTAKEKYLVTKGSYLLKQILRVIIAYFLLQLKIGSMAIVITDFVITAGLLVFDIIYCKIALKVKLIKGKWNNALAKSLFSFSFFVFIQIVIAQTNTSLDRMLLGIFSTLSVVAMYGVVMQLNNLFASVSNVVSGVTFPQISRVVFSNPSKQVLTICCAKYSRYQLLLSAPLMGGFILLGRMFLKLWVPEYNSFELWICTLIIVIPETLAVVEGSIFHVMKAKNLQKTRSLILLGVMIANVIFTIILIQFNDIYGPAIGTGVSYIIGNLILSNIYYHKKVGIDIFYYLKTLFKGIFPAWLLSLIIGFFITLLPVEGWIGFIIQGSLYVIEYIILILLIGLNSDEKKLVKMVFEKVFRKAE